VSELRKVRPVILIESKCGHHRRDVMGIVMRVIAGDPECMGSVVITCLHCPKIAIWINEVQPRDTAKFLRERKRVV